MSGNERDDNGGVGCVEGCFYINEKSADVQLLTYWRGRFEIKSWWGNN